jgi:hypothetical protein
MQGRPDFYSEGCVTYSFVEFQHRYSGERFVREFIGASWCQFSTRSVSVHSEEMVLRDIVMTELSANW